MCSKRLADMMVIVMAPESCEEEINLAVMDLIDMSYREGQRRGS